MDENQYKPSKTIKKGAAQGVIVSLSTAAAISLLLKQVGVDVEPMVIVEVSGVFGLLAGLFKMGVNAYKNWDK